MDQISFELSQGIAKIVFTDANDGDFRVVGADGDVDARRMAVNRSRWTLLRQVHGSEVVTVAEPGEHNLVQADGAVTFEPGCVIAVTTADCAPVVLVGSTGVAVVHAGWRGAFGGVIESAGRELRAGGAEPVAAVVGPCIQPAAYEFGTTDLETLRGRFGHGVEGRTENGKPALDLHHLVVSGCLSAGWPAPERSVCTSDRSFFSHRTRSDVRRQTTAVWIER